MNKFLFSLASLIILFAIAGPVFASSTTIENPLNVNSIVGLLDKIAATVAGIIGTLGVIMLIIAGVLFVTSAGSPEKVNSAKKAFFYAVMGIAVALAATAIINTVKYIIGARS